MTGRYQAYSEYKDSGVEWLGEVPEHWRISKLAQLAYMQEGPGLRNWQFTDYGTGSTPFLWRKIVPNFYVLISTLK